MRPFVALLGCLTTHSLAAQVPQLLNYQGRVQVGTNDFNGTGQFKFALVNGDGSATYWSNDGTPSGPPAGAVTLPVSKGLYSVLLGNTNLPGMAAVPTAAFTNGDVRLRVWFNDGVNGFQQFVPDQRIVTPAYATTAGTLLGTIGVDQLPTGIPRATNGTTTVTGDLVVQGTLTAPVVNATGVAGASGLPIGTTFEVLVNDTVAPDVRFEGLAAKTVGTTVLNFSRTITDLSWPGTFQFSAGHPTNPPVALRLTLPGGGMVVWRLAGSYLDVNGFPKASYSITHFRRRLGSDGKPYEVMSLTSDLGQLSRTNISLFAQGTPPVFPVAGRASGQPPAATLRLNVNGLNFNNVTFLGEFDGVFFDQPIEIILNPSFHTSLSAWLFGEAPYQRSMEVTLVNGLPGTVPMASYHIPDDGAGIHPISYELRLASDGLPVEIIRFGVK